MTAESLIEDKTNIWRSKLAGERSKYMLIIWSAVHDVCEPAPYPYHGHYRLPSQRNETLSCCHGKTADSAHITPACCWLLSTTICFPATDCQPENNTYAQRRMVVVASHPVTEDTFSIRGVRSVFTSSQHICSKQIFSFIWSWLGFQTCLTFFLIDCQQKVNPLSELQFFKLLSNLITLKALRNESKCLTSTTRKLSRLSFFGWRKYFFLFKVNIIIE